MHKLSTQSEGYIRLSNGQCVGSGHPGYAKFSERRHYYLARNFMSIKKDVAFVSIMLACTINMLPAQNQADAKGTLIAQKDHHGYKPKYKGKVERDVMEADDLMSKRDYDKAADKYKEAIARNSKNTAAIAGYGLALGKMFKLDAAEEQCNKALSQDPGNAIAHIGKALVAINRLQSSNVEWQKNRDSMLKQAEQECRQALSADPYSPDAHYVLGMTYKEQGKLDDAVNEFKEAIKSDDRMSEAYAQLGLAKLSQGSNAEAVSNFKYAIQYNSGNATAHYGLGSAFQQQKLYNDAYKELNTALYQYRQQGIKSAPVNMAMGDVLNGQGNTNGALKYWRDAIQIKPELPDAYMRVADVRESRGDLELSISELRGGLEAMPNNPDLHLRIGDESLRLEKLDDAMKEYEWAMNNAPQNPQAAKGLTRCLYLKTNKEAGGAFFLSNEFEKAKAYMDRAIAMNPNDMELRLAQAKLRSMSGETVDLSTIGTPKSDGERIAYAEACLSQNKFKEAKDQMNTVIGNAQDAKQAFAVADLALMIKDLDSAEAAYRKASGFPGGQERAKRGTDLVTKARAKAQQDLNLADDLSKRKQLRSSIDKYHDAIFDNPKVPQARYGLADALDRYTPADPRFLREASTQLKAYLALMPDMPPKEVEKIQKRCAKLEERAWKLEQKGGAQKH